jgi:hypothetical protein
VHKVSLEQGGLGEGVLGWHQPAAYKALQGLGGVLA